MWSTDIESLKTRHRNVEPRGRNANDFRALNESGGFCCQVPPNPACRSLTRQDFKIGIPNRLRGLGNRSIVVVGNYGLVHHGGTIPGKSTSFTPSSILFRPRRCSPQVR